MDMAEYIIDLIGQKTASAPMSGPPAYIAEWPPYPQSVHYKLQKYDYGTHGKKYELDLTAPDESYIARYVIYKTCSAGQEYSRILRVDSEGDECNLNSQETAKMHDDLLATLQRCISDSMINEITNYHMNEEFNALIGRYILSDFAITTDEDAPLIKNPMALRAAEEYRLSYKKILEEFNDSEDNLTLHEDGKDRQPSTLSTELATARALLAIRHKWNNTVNPHIEPSERYPRSS